MTRRAWTLRPLEPADHAGVVKLWGAVAGFDGGVAARSLPILQAMLQHPTQRGGEGWRVAVAGNGALVGCLEVAYVGTVRTEVQIAVNPAWRRQGIGRALFEEAPQDRRLLMTTRDSGQGSSEFMLSQGFTERYREARMRRRARGLELIEVPDGARVVEDPRKDPVRAIHVFEEVFGEDAERDARYVQALLARSTCRVQYLTVAHKDFGVCITAGSERAKKAERTAAGEPTVGVIEQVGLSKAVRGKGMSRSLVRTALVKMAEQGFTDLEVMVDRRRDAAVDLYAKEGFAAVDEDVHWLRKER